MTTAPQLKFSMALLPSVVVNWTGDCQLSGGYGNPALRARSPILMSDCRSRHVSDWTRHAFGLICLIGPNMHLDCPIGPDMHLDQTAV